MRHPMKGCPSVCNRKIVKQMARPTRTPVQGGEHAKGTAKGCVDSDGGGATAIGEERQRLESFAHRSRSDCKGHVRRLTCDERRRRIAYHLGNNRDILGMPRERSVLSMFGLGIVNWLETFPSIQTNFKGHDFPRAAKDSSQNVTCVPNPKLTSADDTPRSAAPSCV